MQLETTDIQPWYKQFWPCFVFAIPATSVVVSMVFIYFAVNTTDTLVVDDYYKQGLAINQELGRIEVASKRSISAQLNFNLEDNIISLRLSGDFETVPDALRLEMIHPTLEHKDRSVMLVKTAERYFSAKLQGNVAGNWHLHLSSASQDDVKKSSLEERWLIKNTARLPSAKPVALIP